MELLLTDEEDACMFGDTTPLKAVTTSDNAWVTSFFFPFLGGEPPPAHTDMDVLGGSSTLEYMPLSPNAYLHWCKLLCALTSNFPLSPVPSLLCLAFSSLNHYHLVLFLFYLLYLPHNFFLSLEVSHHIPQNYLELLWTLVHTSDKSSSLSILRILDPSKYPTSKS